MWKKFLLQYQKYSTIFESALIHQSYMYQLHFRFQFPDLFPFPFVCQNFVSSDLQLIAKVFPAEYFEQIFLLTSPFEKVKIIVKILWCDKCLSLYVNSIMSFHFIKHLRNYRIYRNLYPFELNEYTKMWPNRLFYIQIKAIIW